MNYTALLALEDGTLFWGKSIGVMGHTVGEVVFNTAMTGYQEILSDPSYAKQIITFTYPHIGNVGINTEDQESDKIYASGIVIRDLSLYVSNWRSEFTLHDYLTKNKLLGIADVDTRKLTRLLRDKGSLKGCIMSGDNIDDKLAIQYANEFSGIKGMDLAREVSTPETYEWTEGTWSLPGINKAKFSKDISYHVVAYDFGVKRNILRMLVDRGCKITVVPAQMSVEEVMKLKPQGVFLSNGPGDPEPCRYAIASIKSLVHHGVPVFGICLGHQLLSLASGAKTLKMKFGHHGANHPVFDLQTGKVIITSQNHGFTVDERSLPKNLSITHRSLFDGSLQGVKRIDSPAIGFQGHPEASPGPHDIAPLFDKFIELMKISSN